MPLRSRCCGHKLTVRYASSRLDADIGGIERRIDGYDWAAGKQPSLHRRVDQSKRAGTNAHPPRPETGTNRPGPGTAPIPIGNPRLGICSRLAGYGIRPHLAYWLLSYCSDLYPCSGASFPRTAVP